MPKIEMSIIIENFALDISFQKEIKTMLKQIACDSKKRLTYEINDLGTNIVIIIFSDTDYIRENFKNEYEKLLQTKDQQTKKYLNKGVKFEWKVNKNPDILPRSGKWEDLESYMMLIKDYE